jgi:hypothetical protein
MRAASGSSADIDQTASYAEREAIVCGYAGPPR